MYIFIMDDGSVYQGDSVAVSDLEASDSGILDVIAVEECGCTQYHDNEWHPVAKWGIE